MAAQPRPSSSFPLCATFDTTALVSTGGNPALPLPQANVAFLARDGKHVKMVGIGQPSSLKYGIISVLLETTPPVSLATPGFHAYSDLLSTSTGKKCPAV